MCRMRIRVPEQWWGDYLALLGAARDRRARDPGARPGGRLGRARALCRATGSTIPSSAWSTAIRRLPQRPGHAHGTHDPFPGAARRRRGQGHGRGRRRSRRDRGRPARQPRLPAVRPQSHRGLRARRRWSASTTSIDHACRRTPAASGGSTIQLRENCCVGIPRHPDVLLGRDHQSRRPGSATRCSARSPSSPTASAWPRPARSCRPRWRSSPAATRAANAPFVNQVFLGIPAAPARPRPTAG